MSVGSQAIPVAVFPWGMVSLQDAAILLLSERAITAQLCSTLWRVSQQRCPLLLCSTPAKEGVHPKLIQEIY